MRLRVKKKSVDASYSLEPSSATLAHTSGQFYGTPPPSLDYTAPVGPVPVASYTGPIGQTDHAPGQTSAMVVNPLSLTPLASIPSSVNPR